MDNTLRDTQDHTPGRFAIEQSPFKTADALVAAIQAERGGEWTRALDRVGGRGEGFITVALNVSSRETMSLWQDSQGGWWTETKIRQGVWLPDIDYTLGIAHHLPKPTLLDLARAEAKPQWRSAEVAWLIPRKAFLSVDSDYVCLHIVGKDKPLPVFSLSPKLGWCEVAHLDTRYQEWVRLVR